MNNHSIIINVGRQIGSGGGMIARKLAEEFGCTLYDKELLNLAAKESGFSERFFEENDEQKGFFKSLFHVRVPLVNENNYYHNNFSQESLRDYKNVVNIFITADLAQRVERVCKRQNLTSEEAQKYVHKREEERASYYNYYTGKQWGHADSYDLCVNSSLLGIDETIQLIASFIKERFSISCASAKQMEEQNQNGDVLIKKENLNL